MTDFSLAGFLLSLAAAAALLVWSVRLVRTGVERAFGRPLRGWMTRCSRSRLAAAASGLGAALLLQSATAVLALVTGFSGAGTFSVAAGTAVLLGADLGSALVVRLISLHVSDAMPALLLAGVLLFLRGATIEMRQGGRILIGLALIFVSLQMIRDAATPLIGHEGMGAALGFLGRDPVSAFLIGAALAWLVHSSVATVLLVVTLAGQGLLDADAAAAIVLGANLGGCLIAVGLTLGAGPQARAIALGNLMARGGGAVVVLLLLAGGVLLPTHLGDDPATTAITLHLAFNAAVLVAVLPVVGPLSRLSGRTVALIARPDRGALDRLPDPEDFASAPSRALPRIRRELLQMGHMVETLHREALPLLSEWNATRAADIVETARRLRARQLELRLLAAALEAREVRTTPEAQAAFSDLMQIGAAFEGACSILAGDIVAIARELSSKGIAFSPLGQAEIRQFGEQVAANTDLALQVLDAGDLGAAAELIGRKARLRDMEQRLQRAHMARLAERRPESIATSSQHQDVLRNLKHVNAHMAMVASVLLERRGQLASTRLSRV